MWKGKRTYRSPAQIQVARPQASFGEPGSITDKISSIIFSGTPLWWWIGFGISSLLLLVFFINIIFILADGVGLWSIDTPVVWGVAIINLVFWIGIGHAGTFISAFLLLMRQQWRSTFSRFAEAMTLFALATAGLFPLLHLGRIQFFYYIIPYPSTVNLNPQWTSALVWDFFAISAYGIISLVFWYIDLIPDLAAMRDKAERRWVKATYQALSMGWRGESTHWELLHRVSYVLAALATPLVISVHTIVALDFASAILPGWHHTIFPPYFVIGAVFSGFAMVIIFGILLRSGFGLQNIIKMEHLDFAAKFVLVTGSLVGYGYLMEVFGAWYTNKPHEVLLTIERFAGPYAPVYWGMVIFNVLLIQLLWFKRVRRSIPALLAICVLVLVGMWLERYVIISLSLVYPFMPSMWEMFSLGFWDWMTIISPFGLFLTGMFLFIRFFPVVPVFEAEEHLAEEAAQHG